MNKNKFNLQQITLKKSIKPIQLIAMVIFLVINFFTIIININSVSAFEVEQKKIENKITSEQIKLVNNKNVIENQIIEEIKRKQITSEEEKVKPAEIKNINQLPPASR